MSLSGNDNRDKKSIPIGPLLLQNEDPCRTYALEVCSHRKPVKEQSCRDNLQECHPSMHKFYAPSTKIKWGPLWSPRLKKFVLKTGGTWRPDLMQRVVGHEFWCPRTSASRSKRRRVRATPAACPPAKRQTYRRPGPGVEWTPGRRVPTRYGSPPLVSGGGGGGGGRRRRSLLLLLLLPLRLLRRGGRLSGWGV